MPCKVTFFFNIFGSGFSETYYHTSDIPEDVVEAMPNNLFQNAAKFRYVGCLLAAVRVSTYDVSPRRSLLLRPYPKAQGTRFASADNGPDPASTTAVVRLTGAQGRGSRRVWFRGLADLDVKRDEFGNDTPSATLFSMWTTYVKNLAAAGFAIRYLKRPPDDGLTWNVADLVTITGTDNRTVQTLFRRDVAALPLNRGDKISFRGIGPGLPRWPRQAIVLYKFVDAGRDLYAIPYALPGGKDVFPGKLQYTLVKYGLAAIGTYDFERFSEHKTGRPFGSLRGRSRAVKLGV